MRTAKFLVGFVFAGVLSVRAFAVDPEPYTLGTSFSFRQQGVGSAIMTVYCDGSPTVSASSPSGTTTESSTGVAWLKPGKSYDLLFQSSGIGAYWLSFIAPSGYQVYINGLPQDLLSGTPSFHPYWCFYTVELRPIVGGGRLDAGSFTGIDLGRAIGWEVGLGGLRSGQSVGRIGFREPSLVDAPANRERLFYTPPTNTNQVNVVRTGSSNQILSQILAPQAFVSFVDLGSNPDSGYEIRFYQPSQATWSGSNYTVTGTPWKVVKVEAPAPSKLQISETEGTVTRISLLSLESGSVSTGTYKWKLSEGAAGTWLRTRTQESTASVGFREVIDRTFTGDSEAVANLVGKTKYRYENVGGWGEELRKVFSYPADSTSDSAALVTTYDYHTDSSFPGHYRRVKSIVSPDGNWTAFTYFDEWDKRGQLAREFRPFKNAPASVSLDPAIGVVTAFDYVPDQTGRCRRVSLRTEKVNGADTGKVQVDWSSSDATFSRASSSTFYSATASNSAYAENLSPLVAEEGGEPWLVRDADGPQTSISRMRGTCVNWVFTPNSAGDFWREVRVSGTWSSSAGGTLVSSWDSQSFAPLYVIMNRSTMEVLWRDPAGNVIKRETYVWAGSWSAVTAEWIVFDAKGRLVQHVDNNGTINTTNTWVDGRLQDTTDASGTRIEFVYDALGRVTRSAKAGVSSAVSSSLPGSTAAYGTQAPLYTHTVYDGAGRVKESVTTASAVKPTTLGANDLVSQASYDLVGRIVSSTAPGGFTTTTAYDHVARRVTETLPGAPTRDVITERFLDGQLRSVTGSAKVAVHYDYRIDASGAKVRDTWISHVGSPAWRGEVWDWAGRYWQDWKVGGDGAYYAEFRDYTPGGRHNFTWFNDGRAPRLAVYDSLGFKTREGDDLNGNWSLDLYSSDRIQEFETGFFNSSGWWRRDQSFVYAADNSAQRTLVSKVETQLNGFPAGRVARTDAYDAFGNCTSVTTQIERSLKRVTVTTDHPDSNLDSVNVLLNGLAVERQDSVGLRYRTKFDELGRPTRSTDPRTGDSLTLYLAGTSLVHRVYDALATVAYDAAPLAPPTATTEYTYDSAGRVFSVAVPNPKFGAGGSPIAQLKSYTKYTPRGEVAQQWGDTAYPVQYDYNSFGQRTEMRSYRNETKTWNQANWPSDPGTADVTTWIYDAATGNLKEKRDAADAKVTYTYTAANAVKTRTWARNVLTTYSYEVATRELKTIDYGDTAPSPDVSYSYNRSGQVATVTDVATNQRTFVYNAGLQLERENLSAFYDQRSIVRGYDSNAGVNGRYNRLTVASSTGAAEYDINLGYSADGRIQSVYGLTYSYAPNSHLVAGVAAPGWNYRWERSYEAKRDLVSSSDTLNNTGGYYARFSYARDSLGRVEKATRTQGIFSSYGSSGLENSYDYDDLSQVKRDWSVLTGTTTPIAGRDNRFVYDAFGNRKSAQQGTGAVVPTQPNELNQLESINGVVANYDADGNLTDDGLWSYTYDAENRLIGQENTSAAIQAGRVTAAAARRLKYEYDYLGRRVSKAVFAYNSASGTYGAQATLRRVFLYDGWNLIREFDPTVSANALAPVANHVWGLDLSGSAQGAGGVGGLLFSYHYASGKVLLPIYDQIGNVYGMIDQTGTTVARYEYDAFGRTITEDGNSSADNPIRFSTKYTDSETKLIYYGLRYYSPGLGRFVNRDPIEEQGGVNLYAFVRNNVVNGIDRLGMDAMYVDGAGGAGDLGYNPGESLGNNIRNYDSGSYFSESDVDEFKQAEAERRDRERLAEAQRALDSGRSITLVDSNGNSQTFLPGDQIVSNASGQLAALAAPSALAGVYAQIDTQLSGRSAGQSRAPNSATTSSDQNIATANQPTKAGIGWGFLVGASGTAGIHAGVNGAASAGGGVFIGDTLTLGGYGSAGASAGKNAHAYGLAGGAGVGVFFTNAPTANALSKTTDTLILNIGLGVDLGVSLSWGNGIWIIEISPPGASWGGGVGGGHLNTTTQGGTLGPPKR